MAFWLAAAPAMAEPLTLAGAVQQALRGNPELQATLQEVGITKADLTTAGLVKNPVLATSVRFPGAPSELVNTEYAVSFDFLDLAMRGLRTRLAGTQLQQAQGRAAEAVASLTAQVSQAWYDVAAGQQIMAQEQIVLDASQAASALAQRQFEAGALSDLDLNRQKAETSEINIEKIRLEGDRQVAVSRLRALIGEPPAGDLVVAGELPELPVPDPDEAALETQALQTRPLALVARTEPQALQQALTLQRKEAGLGEVRLGLDRETDADGITVTGPTLEIGLPVFNHNEGSIEKLQAQMAQSQQRIAAVEQQIRLEVRTAWTQMVTSHRQADLYAQELIPIRHRIMQESQLHYNQMLLSVFTLLTDREAEAQATREGLEARRDYWKACAELERSIGGPLK